MRFYGWWFSQVVLRKFERLKIEADVLGCAGIARGSGPPALAFRSFSFLPPIVTKRSARARLALAPSHIPSERAFGAVKFPQPPLDFDSPRNP